MDTARLQEAYARATGRPASHATIARLRGGAGNRVYWRVAEWGHPLVVMELPPEPGRSEEVSKGHAPSELPFLNVRRYLESLGVRVPRLLLDRAHEGYLVLEDLGDETLELALRTGDRGQLYGAAVDALAKLRARAEARPDEACIAFGRAFDFDLYQWEFEHFIEFGLLGRGAKPTATELTELRRSFTQVSTQLQAAPRGFTHRDYQSRNIMVLRGEQVVIDFQDALLGPRQYDLVALLRDSYVQLDRPLIEELLSRWLSRFAQEGGAGGQPLDRAEFVGFFDLLTVQRKLKDAGRFVFIDQVKKNPSFLPSIAPSLACVKAALERRPELSTVREILARLLVELR